MAVNFIFGKPGGGKSLLAFQRVIAELRHGSRPVVTNLPIHADKLNAWLDEQGTPCDVLRRLRLINTEELGQWWRYRGRTPTTDGSLGDWVTLDEPTACAKEDGKKIPLPPGRVEGSTDFSPSPGPVYYVLDEIHTKFNARAWMQTGLAAIFYLSQHRKLGDEVLMISQTPSQVDKQLRSLSQEWIHVTNLGKIHAALFFTLPRRMVWRSYAAEPGRGEPIMTSGIMKVDSPGWADCYATAGGNSIMAQGAADTNERTKGVPLVWGVLAAVALALGFLWLIPKVIAEGGNALLTTKIESPRKTVTPSPTNSAPPQASPPQETTPTPASPATPEPVTTTPPPKPPRLLTAWVKIGSRLTLYTSDGASIPHHRIRSFQEGIGATLTSGEVIAFAP